MTTYTDDRLRPTSAALLIAFVVGALHANAQTLTTLHSFAGGTDDGAEPIVLIIGSNGTLYGETGGGGIDNFGAVFQIVPPVAPGGAWTETMLRGLDYYSGDGLGSTGLVLASTGALYGTTYGGGISGTVFELLPQSAPFETILHKFKGKKHDGLDPVGLVLSQPGPLYGITYGVSEPGCYSFGNAACGTVFKLASGSGSLETVLYKFKGAPSDGGNLNSFGRDPEATRSIAAPDATASATASGTPSTDGS